MVIVSDTVVRDQCVEMRDDGDSALTVHEVEYVRAIVRIGSSPLRVFANRRQTILKRDGQRSCSAGYDHGSP